MATGITCVSCLEMRWKKTNKTSHKTPFCVHFRDILGDHWNFREAFHDDGITDMYEAMKAYYSKPGYGLNGNLFAVGYIKGLIEAVEKQFA